jgi:hypothetical protein
MLGGRKVHGEGKPGYFHFSSWRLRVREKRVVK